jgi:hypothetical protein
MVGQLESKLTEDLRLVSRVGVGEHSRDVRQLLNDGLDVGLGDPRSDSGEVGTGVESCPVLS